MKLSRLTTALLATLVVTAGAVGVVAAAPGGAPDDAGAQADERGNDNATNETGATAGDGAAESDSQGPPIELPESVPERVSAIHDYVRDKIDGLDVDLGSIVSDVTPGDGNANDEEVEANADA